ncbi:hypothetical protein C5S36_02005 [Candidatus Methanophagaceae archaeon]|nr:hypothetical protein C5S36_02005 [Methanophagales archaeon]
MNAFRHSKSYLSAQFVAAEELLYLPTPWLEGELNTRGGISFIPKAIQDAA